MSEGTQAYREIEIDVGYREIHRLVRVCVSKAGLTEYGLRREMPWRNAPRAPGTCATMIYRLTLEPGAVYETIGRPGLPQDSAYGRVNLEGTDIIKISKDEALDHLDPDGNVRRRWRRDVHWARMDWSVKRYVFNGPIDDIPVGTLFEFKSVPCICERKTARQAWIRPARLREAYPGQPLAPHEKRTASAQIIEYIPLWG